MEESNFWYLSVHIDITDRERHFKFLNFYFYFSGLSINILICGNERSQPGLKVTGDLKERKD